MGICGNNDILETVMKINEATRVRLSSQGKTLKSFIYATCCTKHARMGTCAKREWCQRDRTSQHALVLRRASKKQKAACLSGGWQIAFQRTEQTIETEYPQTLTTQSGSHQQASPHPWWWLHSVALLFKPFHLFTGLSKCLKPVLLLLPTITMHPSAAYHNNESFCCLP
jgi:hypothetical protein